MEDSFTKLLPLVVIGVLVAITIGIFLKYRGGGGNVTSNRWTCSSPGKCTQTQDPNGFASLEECNFACPAQPYYYCAINQIDNMQIRTGQCGAVNHVTQWSTQGSCQQGAYCDSPQYFTCDPTFGCSNASAYTPGQIGSYQNPSPSKGTPGSDQCQAQCVRRHECDSQGNCTDLGFSADTTKPEGTCANSPCKNPLGYWTCNSNNTGCVTTNDNSGYTSEAACLIGCCNKNGGSSCGNTCCAGNQQCCKSSDGTIATCYDPNQCETCNNGQVTNTCTGKNCGICQNGTCQPQQCQVTLCNTCVCEGPNYTNCSCQNIDCEGGCCYNPDCPVEGTGQKCSDIDIGLCTWCETASTPCNQCPIIPNPSLKESSETRRQRLGIRS